MERNPDYWRGWDGNHVDSVVVRVVKEPATRYLLMDRGEAHVAIGIGLTDIANLKNNPEVVVEEALAPGTGLGIFRFRGPLEDPNVRKAMVWAFDSEGFVNSAMRGLADPPQGMLQRSFRFFNPDMPVIKQDMEKAKEYISQSEYPDGGFTVSLMILPAFAAYHPAMAQIWQENLKELNITLDIKPMADLATYYASMEDNENGDDMWAWSGQAQTPDHNFQARRQWHSDYTRPRGVNGGYSNPELDALLEEDMQTLDTERRREIWNRVQEILVEDMPSIPFATNHMFWVRRSNVEGAPYNVYNLVPNYYDISLTQ
jgi:ABC-type transport system substrate-binding protein